MRGKMKKQAGFTLIEIVVAIIIGSIMMTVVGLAFVTGMKGYLFARDNASVSRKAQLAMTRISRELMELTYIDSYTSSQQSSVSYTRPGASGNNMELTIYLYEDQTLNPDDPLYRTIKIASALNPSSGAGDILVDSVNSFDLKFYTNDTGSASYPYWQAGDDIGNLSYITITVELERANGGVSSFATVVNPRNNGG